MTANIATAAVEYVAHGWQLVPLGADKRPVRARWNEPARVVRTVEEAAALRCAGIGLAHAYSRTACVDVDDPDAAQAWFDKVAPGLLTRLAASLEAVGIASPVAGRYKLLYKLPDGVAPLRTCIPVKGLELRCAAGTGKTVQDVLPPSPHPKGGAYRWTGGGAWHNLPIMPDELLALWMHQVGANSADLPADVPADYPEPVGLTAEAVRAVLAKIDPDVSYPDWIKVGQALQHERPDDGLELWIDWSAKGSKFPGDDLLREKWDGFGHAAKPVTMRSVIRDWASTADPDEFDVIEDPREVEMAAVGLIPFGAFAQRDTPRWIVRDVLPQAGLGVVYGQPGSGKSFLVFDLAAHVARGLAWNGKRTRKGRVVYAAGEGVGGLTMRTRAYIKAQEVDGGELDDGFKFYPAPVKLLTDDWKPFAKLVEQAGGADVIIVDTLAQSMAGGDENASEDMGRAIGHCRALHEATGALVLLVHHSGKDTTRGARGWSGLRGAADVEIEVVRDDETGQRYARTAKQKDGQDNETFFFRLAPVDLGRDEHGDGLSSCVVEYVDERTGRRKPKGGPPVTLAWQIVQEYVDLSEGTVRIDDVVVTACERSAEQDTTKVAGSTKRALEQLRQQGFITIHNGEVTLT